MRIAYVSIDEVNQALAEQMAAECGAVVCNLLPKDPPPDGLFDAVLYNLDDVPRDERPALLEGLRRGEPGQPTAVHGYDITDEQARTLRQERCGRCATPAPRPLPACSRRLDRAARLSRPTSDSTDLTWVDLAK